MLYSRTIFKEIIKYFNSDDILVIHGARQVGKTHILYLVQDYLKENKKEFLYIDLEDSRNLDILNKGVDEFRKYLSEQGFDLAGFSQKEKMFVLIDEIQYLDDPSSFLKLIADHHKNLKLIVSGSSSFAIKSKFKNSLAGRTINFEAYPLSFEEFLVFKEYSGAAAILENNLTDKTNQELVGLFKEYTLYGGYPKIVLENNVEMKEKYLQQIIDTYIRKDIRDLANIKEIGKFNQMLEVLASQSGCLLDIKELSNTCKIARQTVENYLF
ncbi:MAG: AAA family ATPase, partial [Patescibacteria group bacterium]